MREIKFRGKRIDTGEWVYGFLLVTQMSGAYIIGTKTKSKPHKIGGEIASVSIRDVVWQYEVDPATVGQYTGLKDKNGKEIWEGDICLVSLKFFDIKNEKSKVIFKDGGFQFQYGCCEEYTKWAKAWNTNSIEVIGNIHDNPDLLAATSASE